MDHVVILEAPHHMADGIGLTDVAQKLVTQSLPLRSPRHQAGDIDELHGGWDDTLGIDDLRDQVQARVGQGYHADIGIDGAERVVFSCDGGLRQCVKKGGLAHIGKPDDTAFETHNRPPEAKSGKDRGKP